MTSSYETMLEREQKVTCRRSSTKIFVTDEELNNQEIHTENYMEETPLSRPSFATDDSSSEELAISSVKVSILPGESFNADLNTSNEAQKIMDTGEEEREYKEMKGTALAFARRLHSSVHLTSKMDKSKDKELSLEDHLDNNEKNRWVLVLGENPQHIVDLETASMCNWRKKQIEDQNKDHRKSIGIENQNMHKIETQGRYSCDNTRTEENANGVLQACCKNVTELRLDEVQDEIEKEIFVRQSDSFYDAVRSGNAKRISALIASGSVQNLDEPDWNVSGDPPLLVAATNHCLPVLSTLLANGCDPAVRSPRGETALHRVILNGGPGNVLKFVEDLLKHGCPPGVKEAGNGSTALHVLSRQLAHTPLKSLQHNFDAAIKTLELLAKAGPVNAKDHQGRSALHILASSTIFDNNHKNDIESFIETLLVAGADTALKNDRGETPLHESLECGALNTAMLLISHTSTIITSRYGETPLHIASRKNYFDVVMKLLEHGEDPSIQDVGGNTPLHLASARGFHQTVSLLVISPLAQLEKVNIEGLTALQVAAESGFINAVRILLKAGADPSQTVNYCTTILRRHPDISVLINHELTRRRQLAA